MVVDDAEEEEEEEDVDGVEEDADGVVAAEEVEEEEEEEVDTWEWSSREEMFAGTTPFSWPTSCTNSLAAVSTCATRCCSDDRS